MFPDKETYKDISKTVHVTSVVQPILQSYECIQKTKITTVFNKSSPNHIFHCYRESTFIFVVFAHKNIIVASVLTMSLQCFWVCKHFSCVAINGVSESSRISSEISSFELWRWMKILRVWNDVTIDDRIFIFGWIVSLRNDKAFFRLLRVTCASIWMFCLLYTLRQLRHFICARILRK